MKQHVPQIICSPIAKLKLNTVFSLMSAFNPLYVPITNISGMTPWSLRTTVTPDTVKIFEVFFLCKSLKLCTKWYTELWILVDPVLQRNCVTKSNFRYLKKGQKGSKGKKNFFSKLFQTGQIEFQTCFQSV